MFIKPIEVPFHVKQFEFLFNRLVPSSPNKQRMESQLARYLAGYKGEKMLSYPLNFLPSNDFLIFHNLRLPDRQHYFQIDFLTLSHSFVLILEVKNLMGKINLTGHQMIRTFEDKEEAFPDPVIQAERHEEQLASWLASKGFDGIPVRSLVVFGAKSILNFEDKSRIDQCVTPDFLPSHISSLQQQFSRKIISGEECRTISDKLLSEHESLEFNLLNYAGVQPAEIMKGARCPQCKALGMIRHFAVWVCPRCGCRSKNAAIHALIEYRHLYGPSITNHQFREFLNLESESVVRKILTANHLPHNGKIKHRSYFITNQILEQLKNKLN